MRRSRFPVLALVWLLGAGQAPGAAAQAKVVDQCPPPGPLPFPCRVPVRAAPGFTSLLYHVQFGGSGIHRFVDDIPANALDFRIIDTGLGVGCDSPGGALCASIPAPGGANGTGTVVIENLFLAGPFWGTANIYYEVDFACPPTLDRDPISNQGEVYTPNDPTVCAPCLTDDPVTPAAGDPTVVTASCLPPASFSLRKTASVSEWRLGDDPVIDYQIEIVNPSATDTMIGSEITVHDNLPITSGGWHAFSARDTCILPVTSVPAALLTVNTRYCDALPPIRPYIEVTGLPDIPPLGRVVINLSVVILGGHADQFRFCNEAMAYYNVDQGSTNWRDCLTVIVPPQVVDFRGSVKSVSPDVAFPGEPITYSIAVRNGGSVLATGVFLTDRFGDPVNGDCVDDTAFDPGLDVSVSPGPQPGPATYIGGELFVPLPDIPPGAVQTVTIAGLSAADNACCNRAWVGASEIPDPHPTGSPTGPGDPTCWRPLPVTFRQSTKAVTPITAEPGEALRYTITVSNGGVEVADHVVVTDIFPDCVDDAGFDPATDVIVTPGPATSVSYDPAQRLLSLSFDRLAPFETQTVIVSRLRAGAATAACCNQAFVYSDEVPPRGDPTGSIPGAGDPTCIAIVASGCDLRFAPDAAATPRTPPWVFTNGCSVPPRVDGVLVPDVASDDVLGPVGAGAPGELTLYQLDCPCSEVVSLYKDMAATPATVRIRY